MLKKALLASAIAASLPMSAMAVGPIDGKIYGKINITTVNDESERKGFVDSNIKESDSWNLNSNASRIGVKGKAELSEGFYAIYKAEFEIYVDDGDSKNKDTFEQRNIYAGLSGKYGTVFGGKHDTVLKLSQGKVDLFNDLEGGDIKNWMSGETRASNIINYTTPSMNGFSASVMTVLGETVDLDDDDNERDQDGLFDSYSVGVTYKKGDLYLALARDENVDSGSTTKEYLNITRLVASYSFGDLTLGAVVQSAEEGDNYLGNDLNVTNPDYSDDSYDEDSYTISAKYKMGDFTFKAQYGEGEYELEDETGASDKEFDSEAMVFGVDYKLAKKTKVYAYYSTIETDYDFEDGVASNASDEGTVYGIGMEHKF